MALTALISVSNIVTNCHSVKIMHEDVLVTQAHLSLDEIEDLEGNLTDIIMQLTKYRRALQKEELN